jgi:hypothetical protein
MIKEQICQKCKQLKDISFYAKNKWRFSGYEYICKECNAKRARDYYHKHKAKARAKWNKMRSNNLPKMKAREALRYNVKMGYMKKKPCEKCNELKVESHHEDYEKPLEVIWLCRKHHLEIHNKTLHNN